MGAVAELFGELGHVGGTERDRHGRAVEVARFEVLDADLLGQPLGGRQDELRQSASRGGRDRLRIEPALFAHERRQQQWIDPAPPRFLHDQVTVGKRVENLLQTAWNERARQLGRNPPAEDLADVD